MLLINEIRTGVQHMVSLLNANSKLLSNLPKSTPPSLTSDEDVAPVLSWCEERVLAIQEALVLDTNNNHASVANDNKPMYARQIELSTLIHDMSIKSQIRARKKRRAVREKRSGGISQEIINSNAEEVATPRAVMVTSKKHQDSNFERKMRLFNESHDRTAAAFQEKLLSDMMSRGDPAKDITRFLNDALATHDSKEMLRKANFLSNRKQGRRAGYGYALEHVLRTQLSAAAVPTTTTAVQDTADSVHHSLTSPWKQRVGEKMNVGISVPVMGREEMKVAANKERLRMERNRISKSDVPVADGREEPAVAESGATKTTS